MCLKFTFLIGLTCALFTSSALAKAEAIYIPSAMSERTLTTIKVKADGSSTLTMDHTWLILSETGVNSYGERAIGYHSKHETLEIIEASITQLDGTVDYLDLADVYDKAESLSDGAAIFSDTRYKVLVYPKVQVGSRLNYKIKRVEHTPSYAGHFTYSRFYSPHFIYAHEETLFEVSEQLPLKIQNQGGTLSSLGTTNGYARYRFIYEQQHATPYESRQIDYEDYAPFIMASTFEDHFALGHAYQQQAKPMAAVTPEIQKLTDEITQGISEQREQVRSLYHWVASNIRYVYIGLGDGGLVPQPADTVLKNRYGDCKGHVVLLEALLAAKGIASSPALINSGYAYHLPPLAIHHPFNHVINYIPSLDLYLDATAQFTPFGHLPVFAIDKPVLLTALNQMGRTPTLTAADHAIRSEVIMRMLPDGSIKGTSRTVSTGWQEDADRQVRFESSHAMHEAVKDRLMSYGEAGKGQIETVAPQDFSQAYSESTSFEIEPVANIPGPAAISIPTGPLSYSLRDVVNSKPDVQSATPIYCFSKSIEESHRIELPVNVRIQHLPKAMDFQNRLTHYTSKYIKDGQTIHVHRTLKVEYPDFVCDQDDKRLMADVIDVARRDLRSQVVYE